MNHLRYTTAPYEGTRHMLRGVYLHCKDGCPKQDGISLVEMSDTEYANVADGLFDQLEKMWVWNSATNTLEQVDNPRWPEILAAMEAEEEG